MPAVIQYDDMSGDWQILLVYAFEMAQYAPGRTVEVFVVCCDLIIA